VNPRFVPHLDSIFQSVIERGRLPRLVLEDVAMTGDGWRLTVSRNHSDPVTFDVPNGPTTNIRRAIAKYLGVVLETPDAMSAK
jgi:hypothetical protein